MTDAGDNDTVELAAGISAATLNFQVDGQGLRATRSDDAQPDGAHRGLVAMIRMLLDRRFDCEVELSLDSATVPPSHLSLPWRGGGLGLRLGQTAWLGRHTGRPLRFTVNAFDRVDQEAAA